MTEEEKFMQRALELARIGIGSVSPNPLVGCVIVHNGKIIGEGWHAKYGQAHAEVNAIASVEEKELLRESTVFVNLEPCSHHGKTPPCADLLIKSSVKKVVVANIDTNPLVGGKGIEKLLAAGVEVVTGIREKDGKELNRSFFKFQQAGRPYIILKWAQTADGFIAHTNGDSKWISNEYSRQLVHRWRSEEDAVLVGSATARHDNPFLTVRDWTGRDPVRVVIDRRLALPTSLNLWTGSQTTLCYNSLKNEIKGNVHFIKLNDQGFLPELVRDLSRHSVQSIIVEGGSSLLTQFLTLGLWDEARVFCSTGSFGEGIPAPKIHGSLVSVENIPTDELKIWKNIV